MNKNIQLIIRYILSYCRNYKLTTIERWRYMTQYYNNNDNNMQHLYSAM